LRRNGASSLLAAVRFVLVVLAVACVFARGTARADDWPSRPVKIIVAFGPGGAADQLGRLLAAELASTFKQQFFVENKPGSSGGLGSALAARADPDGYTLLIAGSGPHLTGPAVNPNIGYDPMRDFTHIAMIAGDGYALAVHPALGVRSLAELIALARRQSLAAASPGPGSLGHLLLEQLKRKANIDIQHVPSPGGGVTDVLGNHIPLALTALLTVGEHIRAGTLIGLAVASAERIPTFAAIPTFSELGYPDVRGTTWFWLAGPKDLPPTIVDRLSREVRRIVQLPSTQQRFERQSLLTMDLDVAGLNKFLSDELAFWVPLAKEVGLKVQ
jgi:tripartite-type tricarboxylate transporter receptor subunit TctC